MHPLDYLHHETANFHRIDVASELSGALSFGNNSGQVTRELAEKPAEKAAYPLAVLRHFGGKIAKWATASLQRGFLYIEKAREKGRHARGRRERRVMECLGDQCREVIAPDCEDRDSKVLLARIVVVEVAFADTCRLDDVINTGCVVALAVQHGARYLQDSLSVIGASGFHGLWYDWSVLIMDSIDHIFRDVKYFDEYISETN